MVEGASVCHTCGLVVDRDEPAVRAYRRVEVRSEAEEVPDLRGTPAVFHAECAPDWGDLDWISRAEGPLEGLAGDAS